MSNTPTTTNASSPTRTMLVENLSTSLTHILNDRLLLYLRQQDFTSAADALANYEDFGFGRSSQCRGIFLEDWMGILNLEEKLRHLDDQYYRLKGLSKDGSSQGLLGTSFLVPLESRWISTRLARPSFVAIAMNYPFIVSVESTGYATLWMISQDEILIEVKSLNLLRLDEENSIHMGRVAIQFIQNGRFVVVWVRGNGYIGVVSQRVFLIDVDAWRLKESFLGSVDSNEDPARLVASTVEDRLTGIAIAKDERSVLALYENGRLVRIQVPSGPVQLLYCFAESELALKKPPKPRPRRGRRPEPEEVKVRPEPDAGIFSLPHVEGLWLIVSRTEVVFFDEKSLRILRRMEFASEKETVHLARISKNGQSLIILTTMKLYNIQLDGLRELMKTQEFILGPSEDEDAGEDEIGTLMSEWSLPNSFQELPIDISVFASEYWLLFPSGVTQIHSLSDGKLLYSAFRSPEQVAEWRHAIYGELLEMRFWDPEKVSTLRIWVVAQSKRISLFRCYDRSVVAGIPALREEADLKKQEEIEQERKQHEERLASIQEDESDDETEEGGEGGE